MKVKVVAAMAAMLALSSAPAVAQVSAGVKAGVGIGSLSFDDEFLDETFPDSRIGLVAGGFVDIPVHPVFSVLVEGLFSQQGAAGSFSEDGFTADVDVKLDYFQVPILLNVPIGTNNESFRPFVYGGIAPAFNVSAKQVIEFEGEEDEEDLEDDIKGFDLGVVVGGGLRFGRYGVEVRGNLGVIDINEESDEDGSIKNRQIAILFSALLWP